MEILRADSINVRFGHRKVLTSATLRAESGQVTALFGRNGQGKSTLFRVACGLLEPDGGVVQFRGVTHLRPRLSRLARKGLFLLADRDLLIPTLTLRRQFDWFTQQFNCESATKAAALVGLEAQLDRLAVQCSGGERRRAEIALAWMRKPICLLADEPYRGVAPADAEILSKVFRQMAAEGCAVVITGHEVHTILDIADHIVWCTSGTTYELGTPEMAKEHERFRQEYLGHLMR